MFLVHHWCLDKHYYIFLAIPVHVFYCKILIPQLLQSFCPKKTPDFYTLTYFFRSSNALRIHFVCRKPVSPKFLRKIALLFYWFPVHFYPALQKLKTGNYSTVFPISHVFEYYTTIMSCDDLGISKTNCDDFEII